MMMDMWLLGLLGAGLLAGVLLFDDDDDNDNDDVSDDIIPGGNDDDDDDDNNVIPPVDPVIRWNLESEIIGTNGNDTLVALAETAEGKDYHIDDIDLKGGNDMATIEVNFDELDMGAGNDTLVIDPEDSTVFEEIDLGDGNDVATVTGLDGNVLDAGAGNDSITFEAPNYVDSVLGGDGNDTIVGSVHGSVDGGAGDDYIEVISSDYSGNRVEGGTGNDTLVYAGRLSTPEFTGDVGGATLVGGAGADHFELSLDVGDMTYEELEQAPDSPDHAMLAVVDFDPSEDTIALEVDTDDLLSGRELRFAMETYAHDDGLNYATLVEVIIPEQDDLIGAKFRFFINHNAPLRFEDLNITVNGEPA